MMDLVQIIDRYNRTVTEVIKREYFFYPNVTNDLTYINKSRYVIIVQLDIIVVFVVLKILSIWLFLFWWFQYLLHKYCIVILRIYGLPFLIGLLTAYLWYASLITSNPLSTFHFIEFRPFFLAGTIRRFHGMALTCLYEGSMMTA
jgi:hypothetical protein